MGGVGSEELEMKSIFSLILSFLLVAIPLFCLAEDRDFSKYTPLHNEQTSEKVAGEIYSYIFGIDETEREVTFDNKREIILSINDIIDKYSCNKELYIVNRIVVVGTLPDEPKRFKLISVRIYLVSSTGLIDEITIIYDIDLVKDKKPLNKQSNMQRS